MHFAGYLCISYLTVTGYCVALNDESLVSCSHSQMLNAPTLSHGGRRSLECVLTYLLRGTVVQTLCVNLNVDVTTEGHMEGPIHYCMVWKVSLLHGRSV